MFVYLQKHKFYCQDMDAGHSGLIVWAGSTAWKLPVPVNQLERAWCNYFCFSLSSGGVFLILSSDEIHSLFYFSCWSDSGSYENDAVTSLNVSCTLLDSPTGILPHVRGLDGVSNGDDCDTDHQDDDEDLTCPGWHGRCNWEPRVRCSACLACTAQRGLPPCSCGAFTISRNLILLWLW